MEAAASGNLSLPSFCERAPTHRDVADLDCRGNNQVRHVAVDLSTPDGIAEASTVVAREEPDVLVNMAGVQYFGPAECQSFEDMHDSYMVNLVAPAALCSACLSAMKRRNSGQIANIGSIFGSIPLGPLCGLFKRKGRTARLQRSAAAGACRYGHLRHLRRTACGANVDALLLKFGNMPT